MGDTIYDPILYYIGELFFLIAILYFINLAYSAYKLKYFVLQLEEQEYLINKIKFYMNPNVEKTLLARLGEDHVYLFAGKLPYFPCNKLYIPFNQLNPYYILASDLNTLLYMPLSLCF
jgi:hypothetical protein